jgi:CubicO group peptidase (beta-lactamase class C family)
MHPSVIDAVRDQVEKWAVPGISLATLVDGEVETAVLGVGNAATGAPVRTDTLFQIGSISKIFTTTLLMTLVDEGAVGLDAPIVTWIPDLPLADPDARARVTLRHLVTHHGGFYGDRFDDHGTGDEALARAVAAFGDLPQQTAVGELWTYCNAGFDLTARVIEVVSGRTFESLMRERVLAPLGMDTATYFTAEAIRHSVAVGHEGEAGALEISDPWPIGRRSAGAGGVIATASHLAAFAAMHLADGEYRGTRVLSPASAHAMRAQQAPADPFRTWGLGWSRIEVGGELGIEHGGATNGFRAKLLLLPERNAAIALLTNHENGGPAMAEIARVWQREAFGLVSAPRPSHPVDPGLLGARAGTYTQGLSDLVLTATDAGFEAVPIQRNPWNAESTTGKGFRLRALGDDLFVAEGGLADGGMADFIRAEDGSVRFLRFGGRLHYPA